MKILLSVIILLFGINCIYAQESSGIIKYDRKLSWIKMQNRLPFLSKEDKERTIMTWGKKESWIEQYVLKFTPKESVYALPTESESETGGYQAGRKADFLIYKDFEKMREKDWLEMLGKTYLIDDDLVFPKWKILDEIKEVAGYICIKAETRDTIKGQIIYAWFTDAIATQAGPEMIGGLPGAILELDINNGEVLVTATKIELKPLQSPLALPKKMKGKLINKAQYNLLIKNHIAESIKAKRNPFWAFRY